MSGDMSAETSGETSGQAPVFPEIDPAASGLHAAWYEANRVAGRLTAQRCECGAWRHPARYRCGSCHGDRWMFESIGDEEQGDPGVVESFTITRRPFHGAFAAAVPYPIAAVQSAHGLRWFVQLRSDRCGSEECTARIGEQVTLRVDSFGVPYGVQASDQDAD